jgi:hypothetical protein
LRSGRARAAPHADTIDALCPLQKRAVVNTIHNVSRDSLPLYLNEFTFPHNERRNPDISKKNDFILLASRCRERIVSGNHGFMPKSLAMSSHRTDFYSFVEAIVKVPQGEVDKAE